MDERPEAENSFTRILVEAMKRKPARDPGNDILALLDQPISADLAAYLHAYANHNAGFLELHDWEQDRGPHRTDDPRLSGGAPLAIHIGMTAAGDDLVVRIAGGSEKVALVYHDADEEEIFDSFEDFVTDRVEAARERDKETDLDDLLTAAGL